MLKLTPKERRKTIDAHLKRLDEELKSAIELARQWKPGMSSSAYTMQLSTLLQDTEYVLAAVGGKPDKVATPRKADPKEKGAPEHVHKTIRRLPKLRAQLEKHRKVLA